MQTYIKKPKIGQYLVTDKVRLRVVELYGIDAIHTDVSEDLNQRYDALRQDLGANFRDLYYQALCKVIKGKLSTGEKRGELTVIDWAECQNYSIV